MTFGRNKIIDKFRSMLTSGYFVNQTQWEWWVRWQR